MPRKSYWDAFFSGNNVKKKIYNVTNASASGYRNPNDEVRHLKSKEIKEQIILDSVRARTGKSYQSYEEYMNFINRTLNGGLTA